MDFVVHLLLTVLLTLVLVVVVTSIMTFVNVPPESYQPFMFFFILLFTLHLFLSD